MKTIRSVINVENGISLKRHKKKEHEITSEEGSKDEDMETHVTEIECVECNEKFESVDKVIEHENKGECDQCGKWLGCGTNLGKHEKKEHEITSKEGSKEEENKRDSSEDKEKGEVGIMVCNLSNQLDRSADYRSQNDKSETLQVIEDCGFEYPSKILHECIPKEVEHLDGQISKEEEKSASSSRQLKWDQDVGIYSLVQLTNVGLRNKLNLSMAKSTMRMKNQQVSPRNEKGTKIHKTQESENTYADEVTNTTLIKAPDITTGSTKSDHDTLPYTKY